MKLNHIFIQNYRKYREVDLDFPDGVIAILGANGVGKSTLLEAVAWVLYGNIPTIARAGKDTIRNTRVPANAPVVVELTLTVEGQKYVVRRELRGKTLTSHAWVYYFGEDSSLAEGTNEVRNYMVALLGLDYPGFFASVFARQKELNTFSSESPAERQRLIIRMLKLDAIGRVISKVGGDVRESQARLEEKRKVIYSDDGTKKSELISGQLGDVSRAQNDCGIEIDVIKEARLRVEKELEVLDNRMEKYREKKDVHDGLVNEIRLISSNSRDEKGRLDRLSRERRGLLEMSARLEGLKEEVSERKGVEEKLEKFSAMEQMVKHKGKYMDQIHRLKIELREHISDLKRQRIEEDPEQLEKAQHEMESRKNELEREGLELKHGESVTRNKMDDISSRLNTISKRLQEMLALGTDSTCPTCERSLGNAYHDLVGKYSRKKELKNQEMETLRTELGRYAGDKIKIADMLKNVEMELSQIKTKRLIINEKERNATLLREKIRSNREQIDLRKTDIGSMNVEEYDASEHNALRIQYDQIKKVVDEIRGIEKQTFRLPMLKDDIDKLLKRVQELELAVSVLAEKKDALAFDPEMHRELVQKEKKAVEEKNEMARKLGELNEKIRSYSRDVSRLNAELAMQKKYELDALDLENEIRYLEHLKTTMKRFKSHLISRIRPVLGRISSDFFSTLTQGKYSLVEIDENYEVFIYDGNQKYPLSRFSGGEEDIANLSLRLAISSIIAASKKNQGVQFIVLDEIFGSQDRERRENILGAIEDLLGKFQQIFIITHIEQVREHISNVLVVEELDDGCSRVRMATI